VSRRRKQAEKTHISLPPVEGFRAASGGHSSHRDRLRAVPSPSTTTGARRSTGKSPPSRSRSPSPHSQAAPQITGRRPSPDTRRRRTCRRTRHQRWSLLLGSDEQLDDALFRSEDSSKLNAAFIERLNLTLRQGSAYLARRSPCHARCPERLEGQLELLRCYYNFVRPHRGLKFGQEMRTPAVQAGLASRKLTFREIFTSAAVVLLFVLIVLKHHRRFDRVKSCRKGRLAALPGRSTRPR